MENKKKIIKHNTLDVYAIILESIPPRFYTHTHFYPIEILYTYLLLTGFDFNG